MNYQKICYKCCKKIHYKGHKICVFYIYQPTQLIIDMLYVLTFPILPPFTITLHPRFLFKLNFVKFDLVFKKRY
jgi:hypothetical protein